MLDAGAAQQLEEGLAASTRKAYDTGKNHWVKFNTVEVPGPFIVEPSAEAEDQFMRFVFFLAAVLMLSCGTIRGYLCGVRHYHIVRGRPDPMQGMERLRLQLRGVNRTQSKVRRYMRPLSPPELRRAKTACFSRLATAHNERTIWAAVVLAFFGLLRCSEYAAMSAKLFDPDQQLCQQDIKFVVREGQEFVLVTLKQSKTDPFRHGITLAIGATNDELCPVAALKAMLRGQPAGRGGRDPLFKLSARPMLRADIEKITKAMAKFARGTDRDTNTHSLRRGGACALYAQGVAMEEIMLLGRWRSHSVQLYITVPLWQRAQAAKLMAGAVFDESDPTYTTMDWGAQ